MPPSFHLILLPGLGADHRLFLPQRRAFPGLEVPPWIAPRREESLAAYGRRLAEGLDPGRPLVLGGVSLGGMVALEMAAHLRPAALVLVATCRTGRAIAPWLRFCAGVAGALPERLVSWSKPTAPFSAGRLSGCGRQYAGLVARMYQDADSAFMHWASRAVPAWEPPRDPGCPVFQIHGACDRIIPAAGVRADVLIAGGGHLINLTHADEVNGFIAAAAEKTIATAAGEVTLCEATPADVPAIKALVFAVLAEYGLSPDAATDADLDDLDRTYFAPGGLFAVLRSPDGRLVGTVGLARQSPGRAELRKMYLAREFRGRGLGKRLLEHVLAEARRRGLQEIWLQTNSVLVEAVGLYRRYGFQPAAGDQLAPRCDQAHVLRL